jgi:peptidyl-prolyl cis-trans isomerase SurA
MSVIKAGEDFAALAKVHSRDSHAESGGIYENIARIDLQPEFAALIMDPPEGSIIGPLYDPRGLTIVKVKEKKYGPVPPFDAVKGQLEQRVSRQKNSERYDRWIESLRKKAMIKMK